MTADAARAAADLPREDRARIVAALARRFGDLDLAEDMLQEALAQALQTWPETGVPASPAAWLTTTAKRRALDAIRRDGVLARKLAQLRVEADRAPADAWAADPATLLDAAPDPLPDDRLELLFTCAHPVLGPEDRLALTLRFVAGLTSAEVAHALLVPVPTMQQRLVRAKQRIRRLGVPFEVPRREELDGRLGIVLRACYLLYAEGFARSVGPQHVRDDLTAEAVRLVRILRTAFGRSPEVAGLLGLLLLTQARRPARIDDDGAPVPLSAQDRSRWDRELIAEGISLAEQAAGSPGAGSYAIQAAIAAVHAEAQEFEATDWDQIAVLYRLLEVHDPGPVVRLGRAVALGRARGPAIGLRHLDDLAEVPALRSYRGLHIARALTLAELDRAAEAAEAYRRALALPGNEAESDFLSAALAGLTGDGFADSGTAGGG